MDRFKWYLKPGSFFQKFWIWIGKRIRLEQAGTGWNRLSPKSELWSPRREKNKSIVSPFIVLTILHLLGHIPLSKQLWVLSQPLLISSSSKRTLTIWICLNTANGETFYPWVVSIRAVFYIPFKDKWQENAPIYFAFILNTKIKVLYGFMLDLSTFKKIAYVAEKNADIFMP